MKFLPVTDRAIDERRSDQQLDHDRATLLMEHVASTLVVDPGNVIKILTAGELRKCLPFVSPQRQQLRWSFGKLDTVSSH